MQKYAGPLILIALGCAWLLKALNIHAGIDWVWVIGVGALGIVLLIWRPLKRWRLGAGLWLLAASITSLLRMLGQITVEVEIPVLVILAGMFWGGLLLVPIPEEDRRHQQIRQDELES